MATHSEPRYDLEEGISGSWVVWVEDCGVPKLQAVRFLLPINDRQYKLEECTTSLFAARRQDANILLSTFHAVALNKGRTDAHYGRQVGSAFVGRIGEIMEIIRNSLSGRARGG